jgi:hypothetical protein
LTNIQEHNVKNSDGFGKKRKWDVSVNFTLSNALPFGKKRQPGTGIHHE